MTPVLLMFAGVTVATGFALLEPFLPAPERWVHSMVTVAAAGIVGVELWAGWHRPAALAAMLVALTAATRYARKNSRFRDVVVAVCAATAAAFLVMGWSTDAPSLVHAGIATGAAALVWSGTARAERRTKPLRILAAATACTLLCALAQIIITAPASPPRPTPVIASAGGEHVLVVPQRPGWNLVQAEDGVVGIGTSPSALQHVETRPGAGGVWTSIQLPPGPSLLWTARDGRLTPVPIDTGHGSPASPLPGLDGPDGPECAQAVAAAALASRANVACPSTNLADTDADALRALVTFLATRGTRELALAEDDSPRAAAAARVVRDTAARLNVAVSTMDEVSRGRRPLIIVAGWQPAEDLLRAVAEGHLPAQGAYLAPWLVTAPLLNIPAGQLAVLPYDPDVGEPLEYAHTLAANLPSAAPSTSGYAAWHATEPVSGSFRMYAISPVNLTLLTGVPHEHTGHTWFPAGTITPVSGPITPTVTR